MNQATQGQDPANTELASLLFKVLCDNVLACLSRDGKPHEGGQDLSVFLTTSHVQHST